MAKKSRKKVSKKVLAIDLGGTKVAVAVVDDRGNILEKKLERVDLSGGFTSLLNQMVSLSREFIKTYKLKYGAVASAGPLDPIKGTLLNPTNLKANGDEWGEVPLIRELEKKLKIKMKLENDAASATRAEHWVGVGRGFDNLVIITLGTGVGGGVIANGQLVRSGRHLHTEIGHIILDYKDKEWLCGCGNYGCAEASLSGANFTKHLAKKWNESALTGERLVKLAREGEDKVLQEFKNYGLRLASLLCSLAVMFSPERVIISGGFSHASDLFLPDCELRLKDLMRARRVGHDLLPKIQVSQFKDEAGLLGAAYAALHHGL